MRAFYFAERTRAILVGILSNLLLATYIGVVYASPGPIGEKVVSKGPNKNYRHGHNMLVGFTEWGTRPKSLTNGSGRMSKSVSNSTPLIIRKKNKKRNSSVLLTCSNPPSPPAPNNGLVVGCSLGEQITLVSSPQLPSSSSDPCWFHCAIVWDGPSNWLFTVDAGGPGQLSGYLPF